MPLGPIRRIKRPHTRRSKGLARSSALHDPVHLPVEGRDVELPLGVLAEGGDREAGGQELLVLDDLAVLVAEPAQAPRGVVAVDVYAVQLRDRLSSIDVAAGDA